MASWHTNHRGRVLTRWPELVLATACQEEGWEGRWIGGRGWWIQYKIIILAPANGRHGMGLVGAGLLMISARQPLLTSQSLVYIFTCGPRLRWKALVLTCLSNWAKSLSLCPLIGTPLYHPHPAPSPRRFYNTVHSPPWNTHPTWGQPANLGPAEISIFELPENWCYFRNNSGVRFKRSPNVMKAGNFHLSFLVFH